MEIKNQTCCATRISALSKKGVFMTSLAIFLVTLYHVSDLKVICVNWCIPVVVYAAAGGLVHPSDGPRTSRK